MPAVSVVLWVTVKVVWVPSEMVSWWVEVTCPSSFTAVLNTVEAVPLSTAASALRPPMNRARSPSNPVAWTGTVLLVSLPIPTSTEVPTVLAVV